MAKKPAATKGSIKKAGGPAKRSAAPRKARAASAKPARRPAAALKPRPQASADTSLLKMLAEIFGLSKSSSDKSAR